MNGDAEWLKKLCEDQKICFGIIAISSALFYAIPVYILGLPLASDLSIHLGFFKELQLGVSEWDILPGWAFDDGGYGNVGIRLYPPMASYSLIVLSALTGSLYDAVWLTYLLWMIVGGIGIYFLALEIGGTKLQATFASVIYTMIPFPLLEFCTFFLVAEFIAGAIVPFCFLFALRVCRRRKAIDILLLGLSLSALVLSHIPATILSGISLVIFVLFLLDWRNPIKVILRQCCGIIFALLATAFTGPDSSEKQAGQSITMTDFSRAILDFASSFFRRCRTPTTCSRPHLRNSI